MLKLILVGSIAMMGACGAKQFVKGTAKSSDSSAGGPEVINEQTMENSETPSSPEASAEMPAGTDESPAQIVTGMPLKSDEIAILNDCLKQWTNPPPPFTAAEQASPAVVNIDMQKSNNQFLFEDKSASAQPKLFLLNVNTDIANQGSVALKNPKGWYCINVKAKVINNFSILVGHDTQVAIVSKFAKNDNRFTITRD